MSIETRGVAFSRGVVESSNPAFPDPLFLSSPIADEQQSEGTQNYGIPVYNVMFPGFAGGAKADGIAIDLAAIKAAYAAAVAAGSRGTVYFPPGNYNIGATSGSDHSIELAPGHTGLITFRGAGIGASTIKLGGTVSAFLSGGQSDVTYQNIAIEDLSINENFVTSFSYAFNSWFILSRDCSWSRLSVRRVSVYNCGPLKTSGIERRGFQITTYKEKGPVARTGNDLLIEDYTQTGGNYGVLIQGYAENEWSVRENYDGTATIPSCNVFYDNIIIRNMRWNSGAPLPAGVTGHSSTGIMIGGHGKVGRVLLDNVNVKNASDDLIELGDVQELVVRNSVISNPRYESYFQTCLGSIVDPDNNNILFERCKFIIDGGNSEKGHALISGQAAFGNITFRDCDFINTHGFNTAVTVITPVRNFTIENCRAIWTNTAKPRPTFNSQNVLARAFVVTPRGGTGTIRVVNNDVHFYADLTNDTGFTNVTVTVTAVNVAATDHHVQVEGNTVTCRPVAQSGISGLTLSAYVLSSNPSPPVDDFKSRTNSLDKDYFADSGSAADIVQSAVAGTLVPSSGADKTLEQRRSKINTYDSGFLRCLSGPYTDGAVYVRGRPGDTLTGFKLGAIIKRKSLDTYIEGYVLDDGTDSKLYLDQVVGGVRTQLAAPITLASRLIASTYTWIRTKSYGNTVTVSRHTSTPTRSSAGTDTITVTLADATTIRRFGEAAQGLMGFSWIPIAAGSTITELTQLPVSVYSATVAGNSILAPNNFVTTLNGIVYGNTAVDRVRFRNFVVRDNDLSNIGSISGTVTDMPTVADPLLLDRMSVYGNRLKDGTVDTVLSGFRAQDIVLSGNYTVNARNDTGKLLSWTGPAGIDITLPANAPKMTTLTAYQGGAGVLTFVGETGVVLGGGFTKTNGPDSMVSLLVVSNADGASARWVISGNGQA